MRISHKYKFIYIAPEKTASRSIRNALDEFCEIKHIGLNGENPHVGIASVKTKYFGGNIPSDYYKFSFVRNPFDKAVSWYEYMKNCINKHNDESEYKEIHYIRYQSIISNGFENWIENELAKKNSQVLSYKSYFANEKFNFIGKFENLQNDFNLVCNDIGIASRKLNVLNKTFRSNHYSKYFSSSLVEKINDYAHDELKMFNYRFDDI